MSEQPVVGRIVDLPDGGHMRVVDHTNGGTGPVLRPRDPLQRVHHLENHLDAALRLSEMSGDARPRLDVEVGTFKFLQAAVRTVLERADAFEWTVQGFGFIRTYFGGGNGKEYRLNVWDSRFRVPGVSTIHDHPWDMASIVVAGVLTNQRFEQTGFQPDRLPGALFHFQTIKTGEGGGPVPGTSATAYLYPDPVEVYAAGDSYSQRADEIHETNYDDGTVTLNRRAVPPGGTGEHARVFWPSGKEWVDAIPRPARSSEYLAACDAALARFP